jgi:ParB family chromosome partitioning protein
MPARRPSLGKGLDALLTLSRTQASKSKNSKNSNKRPIPAQTKEKNSVQTAANPQTLPIEFIQPGKYQPRQEITEQELEELASSIKTHGIMQPILVRPVTDNHYEIVAGERRWRAAQLAAIGHIPVVIKAADDQTAAQMALIENLQREDLNPMEMAVAFERLAREFGFTHQQISEAVHKSRVTVTNLMRLLKLSKEVKTLLARDDIEMGHARALLALSGEQQVSVAKEVVAKGLSVRQTEELIRRLQLGVQPHRARPKASDPNLRQLTTELSERLGTAVKLQHKDNGKGKLVISYSNLDQLEGILAHIK